MSRSGLIGRASGKQLMYAKALVAQVGEGRAQAIGRDVLKDAKGLPIDILRPVHGAYSWSKETVLDHLRRDQATILIDALLDEAGRKGRRKNNQARRTIR